MDLFAGAGGLGLGLAASGLDVKLASDNWQAAADTYKINLPQHPYLQIDARDLRPHHLLDAVDQSRPWILAGGPPCQGFTSAGSRRPGDMRNSLVGRFAELAALTTPDVVVFENVEGFLTTDRGSFVFDLLDPLISAGYRISLRKVNVANFGVPQLRKRVIAIAALGRDPIPLTPTHRAHGAPGVHLGTDFSLPPTPSFESILKESALADPPSTWDVAPALSDLDRSRISKLQAGQTMRDLPDEIQHPSFARRANRRVADGTISERRGGAPAGVRRLVSSEPSKAITSAATREFVHPIEDRFITLRECATLQTFPSSYKFAGSKAEVATLIGNAVPPHFAYEIGKAVQSTLAGPTLEEAGKLLEFRPTVSNGMSPALKTVTQAVWDRFGGQVQLI